MLYTVGTPYALLQDVGPVLTSCLRPPVHALCSRPVHTVWLGPPVLDSRVGTYACFIVGTPRACFKVRTCACCMVGTCLLHVQDLCLLYGWDPLFFAFAVRTSGWDPPARALLRLATCARFMVMACACDKYLRHVHPLLRSGPVNARWQGRRRTLWLVHVRASDLRI